MKFLGWLLELLFGKKEEIVEVKDEEVAASEPIQMGRDLTNIIEFIKKEEGFRSKAYLCSGGKWTVGYGETHGVTKDTTITEEEASSNVSIYVNEILYEIEEWTDLILHTYQKDAIVSFVYNFGMEKFLGSTLYKRMLADDTEGIKTQWMRWVYAKRKYQKGLYARRKRELKLYLTGDYSL